MPTNAQEVENYNARRELIAGAMEADSAAEYSPGFESRTRKAVERIQDAEDELESGWGNAKGNSKHAWSKAASASRDAWIRIEQAMPGDTDSDGR